MAWSLNDITSALVNAVSNRNAAEAAEANTAVADAPPAEPETATETPPNQDALLAEIQAQLAAILESQTSVQNEQPTVAPEQPAPVPQPQTPAPSPTAPPVQHQVAPGQVTLGLMDKLEQGKMTPEEVMKAYDSGELPKAWFARYGGVTR